MHDSADAAGTYIVYAFLSLLYQAKNFLKIVKVFFDIPYGTFDLGHIKYNICLLSSLTGILIKSG